MKKILTLALATSAIALTGATAQTSLVAGWDFSQYLGDSFSTIDGTAIPVNTLSANYSFFDTNLSPNLYSGAGSEAFGTLYYNGQFGSDLQNTSFSNADAIRPTTGNRVSNNPLINVNLLPASAFPDQEFVNSLSLQIGNPDAVIPTGFNLVFEALAPSVQTDWVFTFAGIQGLTPDTVSVEFSADGVNYDAPETFNLTTVDTGFSTTAKSVLSDKAYFRLSSSGFSSIDNVGIGAVVPEPSTYAAIAGALALGLVALRRRRA